MKHVRLRPATWYVLALVLATGVGSALLFADTLANGGIVHGYLLWNLALAWIPFGLAVWLRWVLRRKLWSSWEGLMVTAAWLAFLPNAFYMVSDFIHLAGADSGQVQFESILFTSFVYVGALLGLSSLYLVHRELSRRLPPRFAAASIAAILLVCSFAVYIGRDLRWNSWDILVNPAGVLFDVSARAAHPMQYPAILAFVVPFFALLIGMYAVTWAAIRAAGATER